MAIPSGSGTEVLKQGFIDGCDGWTYIRWDQAETADGNTSTGTVAVPANCIVTLLNMTFCQESGSDSLISISTSSASGRTATVTVEVCNRPEDSVTGILWKSVNLVSFD